MAEKPDPKLLNEADLFLAQMKKKADASILAQCKRWRHDLVGLDATWSSLDKTRRKDVFVMGTLELMGGAKFPPRSEVKACEHWIANVENGVKKNYSARLPQWIKNAESSINSLDAKLKSYVSRIDGGGDITVKGLKVARAAGMVAVAFLAARAFGPRALPVAQRLLVAEASGVGASMATGAFAGLVSTNVETVATLFGRWGSGDNIDLGKELHKAWNKSVDAVATGVILGPLGRAIGQNVTTQIFKKIPIKSFSDDVAKQITSLGVGGFNKFVREWLKGDGKREIPKHSKKVSKKLNNKMTEQAMMLIVLEEAAKSPKFKDALVKYAKKKAPKK